MGFRLYWSAVEEKVAATLGFVCHSGATEDSSSYFRGGDVSAGNCKWGEFGKEAEVSVYLRIAFKCG